MLHTAASSRANNNKNRKQLISPPTQELNQTFAPLQNLHKMTKNIPSFNWPQRTFGASFGLTCTPVSPRPVGTSVLHIRMKGGLRCSSADTRPPSVPPSWLGLHRTCAQSVSTGKWMSSWINEFNVADWNWCTAGSVNLKKWQTTLSYRLPDTDICFSHPSWLHYITLCKRRVLEQANCCTLNCRSLKKMIAPLLLWVITQ